MSTIDVVEPHDVVLAEIAADLNLDQFERDFSWIGEPMNTTDWNVYRFIFVGYANVLIYSDLRRPFDNNPVFRTVKVFLQ